MSTLSGTPLGLNGSVSQETHERLGHEPHPTEGGNVNAPALRTDGQPANVERHSDENNPDPELERLAASVRLIQCEEAAARLLRAPQLPFVPGLAPVNNGFWSSGSVGPEQLVSSPETLRKNLRGPLTVIKILILIVSIFAVPAAYYFWAGGWGPISKPGPEMMSFASQFSMPPPTIIAQEDDPGIPAKGEVSSYRPKSPAKFTPPPKPLRPEETTARVKERATAIKSDMASDRLKSPSRFTMPPEKSSSQEDTMAGRGEDPGRSAKVDMSSAAKSSAGETVALLPPSMAGTREPSPGTTARALDAKEIKLLIEQGERFIAAGDVVTARVAFQRAAEAGDANAAVALGATYDSTVLAKLGVVGISADIARARSWYKKAEKLGSPDARARFDALADR